jgi:AcrR family transcriptional regulator
MGMSQNPPVARRDALHWAPVASRAVLAYVSGEIRCACGLLSGRLQHGMATRAQAVKRETTRLDQSDWIEAGLKTLASHGVDAVRVDPLAKSLGVTKGSFYWHFKDRAALLDAMLNAWRRRAGIAVIEHVERNGGAPEERLQRLLELPYAHERSEPASNLELAIRLWGKYDQAAAAAVDEVDEVRQSYIRALMLACNVPEDLASGKAHVAYRLMMAGVLVRVSREVVPVGEMIARLIALP